MPEYINREALINAIPTVNEDKQISLYGAVADFINLISSMPTADVAEVVRCKDCVNLRASADGYSFCGKWDVDSYEEAMVRFDDFCSYGERRKPEE